MSKEMTAEEYKEHFDQGLIPFIRESTKTYGDLRAKEAVREFAEELIAIIEAHQYDINHPLYKEIDEIKHLAKQKGVEI